MGKVELNIDETLLAQAQAIGLSPERIAEAAIREAIERTSEAAQADRAARWATDNAEAIAAHEAQIAKHGVFGDRLRTW
jgi:antitoxin CcdA